MSETSPVNEEGGDDGDGDLDQLNYMIRVAVQAGPKPPPFPPPAWLIARASGASSSHEAAPAADDAPTRRPAPRTPPEASAPARADAEDDAGADDGIKAVHMMGTRITSDRFCVDPSCSRWTEAFACPFCGVHCSDWTCTVHWDFPMRCKTSKTWCMQKHPDVAKSNCKLCRQHCAWERGEPCQYHSIPAKPAGNRLYVC